MVVDCNNELKSFVTRTMMSVLLMVLKLSVGIYIYTHLQSTHDGYE